MNGRTLKIYVMGQASNSLKTVEIINWTGLAFLGERQHLTEAKSREELSQPGIYLLLSYPSSEGLTEIYIGETDDFNKRIVDHNRGKDWWERFIVFVSKDQNLTKAHVKYLESEIYKLAKLSVAKIKVMNDKSPGGTSLPESDVSSMQEFLQNIKFVLETLGLSYFSSVGGTKTLDPNRSSATIRADADKTFYLTLPKEITDGKEILKAKMTVKNGVYILRAGSCIRKTARESFVGYRSVWQELVDSEQVKPTAYPEALETTADVEFRSPSEAASVARGRSSNGRTEWKTEGGDISLGDCLVEADT